MKMKLALVAAGLVCVLGAASPYVYEHLVDAKKINNSVVRYASPSKIKVFPVPIVHFTRDGLASAAQIAEIKAKIIYPLINSSKKPIAAITVDFYSDRKTAFGVSVHWHDGTFSGQLIERVAGKIPFNAYRPFLNPVYS